MVSPGQQGDEDDCGRPSLKKRAKCRERLGDFKRMEGAEGCF